MSGHNVITAPLRFHCPACGAELSVPAAMAGVEGPCPSCFQTIQAPVPEAVCEVISVMPGAPVPFPPVAEQALYPIPQQPRMAPPDPAFANTVPERQFKARLAIPPTDEPLDEEWKERHRQQSRQSRRARKAENVADSFLRSRGFQVARVAMIMLSGAMLVWLFQYLQNHQWRLPGMAPPAMAEEKAAVSPPVRAVGTDANELMADDDTEIPPASNHQPLRSGLTVPQTPVAGRVP